MPQKEIERCRQLILSSQKTHNCSHCCWQDDIG